MRDSKYLFISVKPIYAKKILSQEKSIELRKLRPKVSPGDYIIIYASIPIGAVGIGQIKQVIVTSPQEMWNSHSQNLGIEKVIFDEYYAGKERAIGIEIDHVRILSVPIPLFKLRELNSTFSPPQVYRYVTSQQICDLIEKL